MSNQDKQQQQQQQQPQGAQRAASDTEPLIIEERVQIVNGEQIIKRYQRGSLLGKGGFAKCFQVTNLENKKVMAAKIIPKSTLVKNRARQKLISEIKIHKSLHHNNIVKFEHVFEDHDNVYILLELCPHQTLNELIKRRKRITELETLCYTVQIVQALKYLHQNRVIHRDLKLGNLFVGEKMEIKLGDFGLATKLEFDGEKKRTICGTPNYIAPEILDGRVGHSYEVDIWSLGVILYTLLIGKPPFETHDVKTTYRKIKSNQYSFPDHAPIPDSAKALIQLILQQDPAKRPTLDEILAHPFINNGGTIPRLLPVSTLTTAPNTSYIKQYAPSASNIKANQQSMQIGTEVFGSSRKEMTKSQTTTNMNKALFQNENGNKVLDGQKNQATSNPSNQFMSTANLQQNSKNLNSNFNQNDFNQTDQRPTTSKVQTGTQQGLYNKQQTGTQDPNNKQQQGNKYQSVQNLMSMNKTDGFQNPQNQQQLNGEENNQIDGSKNNLWVVQYVDYSSKYGLGYLLSNQSAGVVFNDTTKIILDPKAEYFEYIYKKDQDEITEKHSLTEYPTDLQKKVTLLQHFRHYLMTEVNKKVCAENGSTQATLYNDSKFQMQPNQPLPYLKKWMQTRHAIMFRLSNKIVQVQFSDKTEILLNSTDKIVSFMNKKGERFHYPLADAMNSTNQDMTKRLRYTKEILTHLLKNNQRQNTNDEQGNNAANSVAPPDDMPQNEPNYNKYGMTATMENEQFPKLNEQKLKGMTSQKSLTEKDQLIYNMTGFNNGSKTPSQQKNPSVTAYPNAQQQPAQLADKNQKK
ncbi:Serine/Threonine kinase (macronuclear) [Tetrahymena thermophila SB210]|uniref:Serine/threonine-protein kinase PLK n=1 Tax=Tetrahymena thermophila (strain SB210) TaxID=312017 RepID=Q22C41_TETTS|nr:Serine/Threonine kinase [Tetrahymena thermophila SB210]EAR82871.2 Serine/Threonine kinase [Tetrahymena thermophila SB210]|eukprot:XP_001030534.2 Serine/Threonine kinase [Tetrahymena thermophila SB210]